MSCWKRKRLVHHHHLGCKKICTRSKRRRKKFTPAFGTVFTGTNREVGTAGQGSTPVILNGFTPVISENVSPVGDGIKINKTGCYKVGYGIEIDGPVPPPASGAQVVLLLNGQPIEETRRTVVAATGQDENVLTAETEICLEKNDLLQLQVTNPGTPNITVDSAVIAVGRVRNKRCFPINHKCCSLTRHW